MPGRSLALDSVAPASPCRGDSIAQSGGAWGCPAYAFVHRLKADYESTRNSNGEPVFKDVRIVRQGKGFNTVYFKEEPQPLTCQNCACFTLNHPHLPPQHGLCLSPAQPPHVEHKDSAACILFTKKEN